MKAARSSGGGYARAVKVLLVHAGGTLMMRGGKGEPMVPDTYARDLLSELPALRKIATIDTRILFQLDSSDMQPENWIEMAAAVHESLSSYDGIVVVHGTDTMAYTASALAFLLPGLDKPVILTGSQRPLNRIRSDARQNLIDAVQLATKSVPEVGLAFASKLWRGCRSTKVDAWGLNAFASPACPPLAELGVSIELADHILSPRPAQAFDPRIEPRVLAVRLFPGLEPAMLAAALTQDIRGLVLKAFGAGNIPRLNRSLLPVIEQATKMDIPVVIVSQCTRAHVDLNAYAGGKAAKSAGAIGAGDMTDEAALTKLMVTLGRHPENRVAAAQQSFASPSVGEMTKNMAT
jgi:L-asparaginase